MLIIIDERKLSLMEKIWLSQMEQHIGTSEAQKVKSIQPRTNKFPRNTWSRMCVRAQNVNLSWMSARILCRVGLNPASDSLCLLSCSPRTSTFRMSASSQRASRFASCISLGRNVSYKYVHLQVSEHETNKLSNNTIALKEVFKACKKELKYDSSKIWKSSHYKKGKQHKVTRFKTKRKPCNMKASNKPKTFLQGITSRSKG